MASKRGEYLVFPVRRSHACGYPMYIQYIYYFEGTRVSSFDGAATDLGLPLEMA